MSLIHKFDSNNSESVAFKKLDYPIISPRKDVPWADFMTLNPAIFECPGSDRLHMLFRASGSYGEGTAPIFLGYAWSDDEGLTWKADFSRPCLSPRMGWRPEDIIRADLSLEDKVNYANGCIEDPRLHWLGKKLYLTTACRMFPPGPYWEHDEPLQCAPEWAKKQNHHFGRAASENLTVTVLFEVDFEALTVGDYEAAFQYVCKLTNPELGDNRDAFLFPEKWTINGREQYLALHRPFEPSAYDTRYGNLKPSIFVSAADCIEELGTNKASNHLMAAPRFKWEANRIGASWPPIKLEDGGWLVPYHGKQDSKVGYTQSFMIVKPGKNGWPEIIHRCSERLLFADREWELKGLFETPCLFTCGGIVRNGKLLMSYGAADTYCGVAWTDFAKLVRFVRTFDHDGNRNL